MAAPSLSALSDVTMLAGAPLHIALNGTDADGDTLSFTAASSNSGKLTAYVHQGNPSLRISVQNFGDMEFQLFKDWAPNTVERIMELTQTPRSGQASTSGFYDGLIFHRVIKDFMIQGGDPLGDGTGGSGVKFDDEFRSDLQFTSAGLLAMAKGNDDTNDSQFFITAKPTRWLDFNHTIFGLLTKGDEVRQAIGNVSTNTEDDKPVTNVVMSSVQTFIDPDSGVLTISAPEGTTGQVDVTVSVNDGHGGTDQKTFRVTIQADTTDADPYLLPMADLQTKADTPVEFNISAIDVEGAAGVANNAIHYYAAASPDNVKLAVSVTNADGRVRIAPSGGLAGVFGIVVGVRKAVVPNGEQAEWDSQTIPLLIRPAAPSVQLLAGSDTGSSAADGITNLNNSSSGKALSFRVTGTVAGAVVTLYDSNGQQIGQATAAGDSVVIVTDGSHTLIDGMHYITAKQVLKNQPVSVGNRSDQVDLSSDVSAALPIIIDTTAPQIASSPVVDGAEGAAYRYDVVASDERAEVSYRLETSPAGMVIDSASGRITWAPQPGQGPSKSVVVVALDTAGNSAQQSFTITLNQAPTVAPVGDQQVAEGSRLTFTVSASDPQAPVTFSLAPGAPVGATINPQTGAFSWTPSEAQGPGLFLVGVLVKGAMGATATEVVKITVTEVNTPPVMQPIGDLQVDEGQLIDFVVPVVDGDLPVNKLSFSLAPGAPAGATIDPATGRFTFRPNEAQGGADYNLIVRVNDEAGTGDEKSFRIRVREVNEPPAFSAIEQQVVGPGERLRLVVHAADPDIPAMAVRYSLEPGAPAGATIDADSGLLTWTVPQDFERPSVQIVVRATEIASDGMPGLSNLAAVQVVVFDFESLLGDITIVSAAARRGQLVPPSGQAALRTARIATLTDQGIRSASGFRFTFGSSPTTQLFTRGVLFGTQIGPDTSVGRAPDGSRHKVDRSGDQSAPERPIRKPTPHSPDNLDEELEDNTDRVGPRPQKESENHDLAIESLAADDTWTEQGSAEAVSAAAGESM